MDPAMPPTMSTGIMMVETRKALVRTRSRYSRLAMSQMLRIDLFSGEFSGFRCYLFDEDLFERWLGHFKPGDMCFGDGRSEQRLGVRALAELDLRHTVIVFNALDGRV